MLGDGRVLFGLPASITAAVVAGSWIFMPAMGVLATGVAWLAAQSVAAVGALLVEAHHRARRAD